MKPLHQFLELGWIPGIPTFTTQMNFTQIFERYRLRTLEFTDCKSTFKFCVGEIRICLPFRFGSIQISLRNSWTSCFKLIHYQTLLIGSFKYWSDWISRVSSSDYDMINHVKSIKSNLWIFQSKNSWFFQKP